MRAIPGLRVGRCGGGNIEGPGCPRVCGRADPAYSLVHDDLPAMDDDELRRGRLTCHRAFGRGGPPSSRAMRFSLSLSRCCRRPEPRGRGGASLPNAGAAFKGGGVAWHGGRAGHRPRAAVGRSLSLEELEQMHVRKTGALIRASILLGALCASADDASMEKLDGYARCVGLAFQIQDDVLDVEGEARCWERRWARLLLGKPTYPSVLGLSESRRRAVALHDRALDCIADLDLPLTRCGCCPSTW